MKAIFISYNQAFNQEIIDILEECGQRGYTLWQDIGGRGGVDGEPHLGNHAWPVQNHAVLTVVEDGLLERIMESLRAKDASFPDLGLRAWTWDIESSL